MFRWTLLTALIFISTVAHGARIKNAYISFELPPNWNCKLEGSEWVCESNFSSKTKDAIIILTAKEVGPDDTLPAYLKHLQTPRAISSSKGPGAKSQVINVKERILNGQMWIDGMHLGSEVGPYFTRYLATVKNRISIVITFSAHKQHFTKYSNDFIRAVESLQVVATSDVLGRRLENNPSGGGQANKPDGPMGPDIPQNPDELMPAGPRTGIKKYSILLWLAGILFAVGVFLYYKASNAAKKPKPLEKKKK